jgi:hypothetical protein
MRTFSSLKPMPVAVVAAILGIGIGFAVGFQTAAYAIITDGPPTDPITGEPPCCSVNIADCGLDEIGDCQVYVTCSEETSFCGSRPCCNGLACTDHVCVASSSSSSEESSSSSSEESLSSFETSSESSSDESSSSSFEMYSESSSEEDSSSSTY